MQFLWDLRLSTQLKEGKWPQWVIRVMKDCTMKELELKEKTMVIYKVLRYLSQHFSVLVYPVFLYGVVPPTFDKWCESLRMLDVVKAASRDPTLHLWHKQHREAMNTGWNNRWPCYMTSKWLGYHSCYRLHSTTYLCHG